MQNCYKISFKCKKEETINKSTTIGNTEASAPAWATIKTEKTVHTIALNNHFVIDVFLVCCPVAQISQMQRNDQQTETSHIARYIIDIIVYNLFLKSIWDSFVLFNTSIKKSKIIINKNKTISISY